MRKFVSVLPGVTAISVLLSPAAVLAQAPAQLRGKSVVASWTEERVQRASDETDFSTRSVPQTLSVYISSEGRIFAKRTAISGKTGGGMRPRGSGSASSVGEDAAGSQ